MLQYIDHKDLAFPQGLGGALAKGFLKKVLTECAEPAAAQPVRAAAPASVALTEGSNLLQTMLCSCELA